jgi:lipopolysaccharide transport protein LptA
MRRCFLTVLLLAVGSISPALLGQDMARVSAAPPKPTAQKTAEPNPAAGKKPKSLDLSAGTTGPITTEIYADEAFFDSNKNVGIFRGRVKLNDPRFNLQADKLTVFIMKGENQGLEKAVAEGNVAVVRDRPDPNGGAPSKAVGRAESAVYLAATGDVELKGTPRVQQGLNTHVGTSSETVMVINQTGQLTTRGPSRTEIRQEPKNEKSAAGKQDSKSAEASPKP